MGTRNEPIKSERLTAVVLCKDAGATLRKCLLSLTFCDQVIVADDGSTDASREIAKYYGVKLIKLESTDSFAEKRNQTLSQVPAGWVLFVDADEWVGPKLASSILSRLKNPQADGYFIFRRDIFLGKQLLHGEPMWLLRLARVESGKWGRHVHEVWNITGRLERIPEGKLFHTPHPSLESFLDSINHYTQLEVKERVKVDVWVPLVWLQLFLYPVGKFIQNYILRLGMLDGVPGLIQAYMMSLHSLLVRIKILEYVHARSK